MKIGIKEAVDMAVTEDEQFLILAYASGLVNLHFIGDNSFEYVATL